MMKCFIYIFQDLNVVRYPSMAEAMKDCCSNVWAVVEIIAPRGGFDCSDFRDFVGGSQHRGDKLSNDTEILDFETQFAMRNSYIQTGIKVEKETEGSGREKKESAVLNKSSFSFSSYFTIFSTISNSSRLAINTPETSSNTHSETETKKEAETPNALDVIKVRALMDLGPSITVRMLPSAIPDTRNFE